MSANGQVKRMDPHAAAQWLKQNPGLTELQAEFPEEWEQVRQELAEMFRTGPPEQLQRYLKRLSLQAQKPLIANRPGHKKGASEAVRASVRYRMAHGVVKRHYTSVASGIESGRVRFNLLNGLIAQKLLFAEGLERKPVSMFWFRLIWPLLWQKRMLLPLVQPEGIYCFYSRKLITALAKMIGTCTCLEIAAGDGTLSRFLTEQGVNVQASDDYSWEHAVRYPEWVVRQDANESLRSSDPEVVICSWPPSGNSFERQVFRTKSVQLYIVIGSSHRHAAGNWGDYQEQTTFSFEEDKTLGRLVLPPELDSAVYLFRRKSVE